MVEVLCLEVYEMGEGMGLQRLSAVKQPPSALLYSERSQSKQRIQPLAIIRS